MDENMSDIRDPDFDAITEKEIFEEARDRKKLVDDDDSSNRKLAKADALFREGENHWDNEYVTSASEESPELVINFTDTLVNRVVNGISEREPRGRCHPVGDGADTERADVINGIGRHVEYRSEASVAYDIGVDSAVTIGWGWWELLTEFAAPDSFDKEMRIGPIMNAFSVYADPSAVMPTACDMKWALITAKMRRIEYKRLYPDADPVSWSDGMEVEDWDEREEIRLARYFRIREKADTLYEITQAPSDTAPQGRTFTLYKNQLPSDKVMRINGLVITRDRESSRRQVQLFWLNGTKVIEREILPGSYIPLIRCQGNARNIDGKMYRRGMVRTLQDPQRMVDYGEVAKIKRLGLTPQAPWTAYEGQLDGHPEWTDSNRSAFPVLTHKPVVIATAQGDVLLPPPTRQPPAQIEAGFSEFVQGMRSNLLAIAGMPNEPGQDQGQGQAVSGRALLRRDKLSDQSHSQYYKNQKLAIAHTWRIMLEWIPHYYSEERIQRIIGEDGKPQMVKLNEATKSNGVDSVKNDLSVGRYDVVMESGPSYETKREEGADSLLELTGSPTLGPIVAKTAPDLVFRAMDFPYAEEIADRLAAQTPDGLKKIMESLPKEARAVVQSLASENANLKQALQQAQVELKYGLTKAQMDATVKAHDVEETNKTKRADTESRERTALQVQQLKGHVQLAVEEIAAGASLLNTHTEAKYHEQQAERVIEQGEKAGNA
jgi:hypothetical protein